MSLNNCPASKFIIKIGTNTKTVVNADTITADQTCLAPKYAASFAFLPFSLCLYIFSRTTIAASTTIPTANAIPAKEITFIDLPRAAIATKAATTDIGIDNPIITVARHDLKNNIKINIAKVPPIQIFCLTSSIAESIYIVSS